MMDGQIFLIQLAWLRFKAARADKHARPGQTTVEYLLMLAVVASVSVIVLVLFHKKILGGLFTMVGMVIGSGQPTP